MVTLRRRLGFYRMTLAEGHEYWGQKMKDGRIAFVLRFGILQWGIAVGIVTASEAIFLLGLSVPQAMLFFLFMTLVGGSMCGFLFWYLIRWRFSID